MELVKRHLGRPDLEDGQLGGVARLRDLEGDTRRDPRRPERGGGSALSGPTSAREERSVGVGLGSHRLGPRSEILSPPQMREKRSSPVRWPNGDATSKRWPGSSKPLGRHDDPSPSSPSWAAAEDRAATRGRGRRQGASTSSGDEGPRARRTRVGIRAQPVWRPSGSSVIWGESGGSVGPSRSHRIERFAARSASAPTCRMSGTPCAPRGAHQGSRSWRSSRSHLESAPRRPSSAWSTVCCFAHFPTPRRRSSCGCRSFRTRALGECPCPGRTSEIGVH